MVDIRKLLTAIKADINETLGDPTFDQWAEKWNYEIKERGGVTVQSDRLEKQFPDLVISISVIPKAEIEKRLNVMGKSWDDLKKPRDIANSGPDALSHLLNRGRGG